MDLFKNHRLAEDEGMFAWLHAYIAIYGSVCPSPQAVSLPFYWSEERIFREFCILTLKIVT